jgi:hypothetical protein
MKIYELHIQLLLNIDDSNKPVPLTGSVLGVKGTVPYFTCDFRTDEIFKNYTFEEFTDVVFNKKKFIKKIKHLESIQQTNVNKAKENNDNKSNIGQININDMLRRFFPTKFPTQTNIESSNSIINGTSLIGSSFLNYFINSFHSRQYAYLSIGSKKYTVIRTVWLDDIINHPLYRGLMESIKNYYMECKRMIEKYEEKKNSYDKEFNDEIDKLNGDIEIIEKNDRLNQEVNNIINNVSIATDKEKLEEIKNIMMNRTIITTEKKKNIDNYIKKTDITDKEKLKEIKKIANDDSTIKKKIYEKLKQDITNEQVEYSLSRSESSIKLKKSVNLLLDIVNQIEEYIKTNNLDIKKKLIGDLDNLTNVFNESNLYSITKQLTNIYNTSKKINLSNNLFDLFINNSKININLKDDAIPNITENDKKKLYERLNEIETYKTLVEKIKLFRKPKSEIVSNTDLQNLIENYATYKENNMIQLMETIYSVKLKNSDISLPKQNIEFKKYSDVKIVLNELDLKSEIYLMMDVLEGTINDDNKGKISCAFKGENLGRLLEDTVDKVGNEVDLLNVERIDPNISARILSEKKIPEKKVKVKVNNVKGGGKTKKRRKLIKRTQKRRHLL